MNKSTRFSLNKSDVKKLIKNAVIFLAPALLLFLTSIQSWKTVNESLYIIYLRWLNTAIDTLRKFISSN